MRIKIKKIAATYAAGDDVSLLVEYEIEGELSAPIEVGKSVLVFQDRRNGKKADGIFQTTKVLEVSPEGFRTRNSVYVTGSSCSEH